MAQAASGSEYSNDCDRCGKNTRVTIMSMFNTDILCMACKSAERERPDYEQAVQADEGAIRGGNYNFRGIGWKEQQ